MTDRRRSRPVAGIVVGLLLALTGCGAPASADAGCPAEWSAAVLWSTENGAQSELVYLAPDGAVTERALPFLGFPAVPAPARARHGTGVLLVSNGNMDRDRTQLVTMSARDCSLTSRPVPEALLLAVEDSPQASFTANWVNGSGWIRRHDKASGAVTEAGFRAGIGELVVQGDTLYVFATDDADQDRPMVLVLEAGTLAERTRIRLDPEVGAVSSAVVAGGALYFPYTGKGDGSTGEGRKLGVLDLRTHRVSSVALDRPAPYVLAATQDAVYVVHTFLNPSFRPMRDYVWVSRYRPATKSLESFDLGRTAGMGVLDLAIAGETLWVLGSTADDDAVLASFDAASMRQLSRVELRRPTGDGHRYLAGLVVPG